MSRHPDLVRTGEVHRDVDRANQRSRRAQGRDSARVKWLALLLATASVLTGTLGAANPPVASHEAVWEVRAGGVGPDASSTETVSIWSTVGA